MIVPKSLAKCREAQEVHRDAFRRAAPLTPIIAGPEALRPSLTAGLPFIDGAFSCLASRLIFSESPGSSANLSGQDGLRLSSWVSCWSNRRAGEKIIRLLLIYKEIYVYKDVDSGWQFFRLLAFVPRQIFPESSMSGNSASGHSNSKRGIKEGRPSWKWVEQKNGTISPEYVISTKQS